MCLITLQGTCHKSCHKSGAATRKWSKSWSFCNSMCHATSVYRKPIIMFIQCVNNETTVSQLPWKGNDVPIPKTGQLKENFKIQTRINCYSVFIVHVVKYEREDPLVEYMRCYEWFHQQCEKIPRKLFTNTAANFFCKGCRQRSCQLYSVRSSWTFAS